MKFVRQLQFEGMFILKNWFFLLAPILYFLGMVLWFHNQQQLQSSYLGQYSHDYYSTVKGFLGIGHTLSLGVIFLASVLAIRREKQTILLDWTNSLPNSFLGIILAKYAALFFYSCTYSLLFFFTYLLVGSGNELSLSYLLELGFPLFIQSQLSYGITISLGMVLAVLIPNRIVYIIVFCAWMFGTFFMEGFIIQRYHLYFLKTFHLNQFFLESTHSDTWGFRLGKQEWLYSQVFVFFFSLLLLAISIIKSSTDRLTSFRNKKWLLFSIVVVVTIASFTPYGTLWSKRIANYEQLKAGAVNRYDQTNNELVETMQDFYEINSYHMEVVREGNSDFSVQAQLLIPENQYKDIHFTLYPTFQIEKITWNGEEVFYERDHHLIIMQELKQQELNKLEVTYSGSLNEWGYLFYNEGNFAFLHEKDMYFPYYIGWYPLPGDFPIYVIDNSLKNSYIQSILYDRPLELNQKLSESDFFVKLVNFEHPVFSTGKKENAIDGSQQFSSINAKGISFLSDKNVIETKEAFPLSIIATPANAEKLKEELRDLEGTFSYLSTWLDEPIEPTFKLAYLPSLEWIGIDSYYMNRFDQILLLEDNLKSSVQKNDGEIVENTYNQIQGQLITNVLFNQGYYYSYWYDEEDVSRGIQEAYLLVLYKDFLGYEWEDFDEFNGSYFNAISMIGRINWLSDREGTNELEKLEFLRNEFTMEKSYDVVLMIAVEIEKGNLQKIKTLLKHVYHDMRIKGKEKITYDEWMHYWNSSFESGGMR
ncbi:ABC-2 family transporter protein [Bacillus sp. THAF10]|uniref:hypothetical protein n=1 Tax=Bacillus sp. THAF10 TaxID=2587848 RepID=UPI0012693091|nr:hypothetical protein [Bacillus sp. THAF10]QFT90411.1 ABC-2 family transporter protein [Bacillus sp. THAF10]